MTNTPKQSLGKRLFLGYGKVCYKIAKGTVKVFKSPTTRKVLQGIAQSTDRMVVDHPTSTQRPSPSPQTTQPTKRDVHIHIHLDKDDTVS